MATRGNAAHAARAILRYAVEPPRQAKGCNVSEERMERCRLARDRFLKILETRFTVDRDKLFGGDRGDRSCFVRWVLAAMLTRCHFSQIEVGLALGCSHVQVSRINAELVVDGPSLNLRVDRAEVRDALRALEAELELEDVTGAVTSEDLTFIAGTWCTVEEMRESYETLTAAMLDLPDDHALAAWERWCRSEYPHSWRGAIATLPREFRLRRGELASPAGDASVRDSSTEGSDPSEPRRAPLPPTHRNEHEEGAADGL